MSDSKPYRDGPSIKTGDRVVFVDGDGGRTEGIAHVDSAIEWNRKRDHETRVAIAPDGVETTSYIPTAEEVRHLREQSGAPVTMCRDALAAEDGNQGRAAEWLRLRSTERWPDGGPRRPDNDDTGTVSASIPDGEPWEYGRDFTLGDRHVCDDTCSVGPFAPIPPDEALTHSQIIHRRIYARLHELGVLPVYPLPDIPFEEASSAADRGGIIQGGKLPAWMVDIGLVEPEPETAKQRALPRPSTTPPPWADNPAGQRRPTKTRNHRRVK